MTCNAKFFFGNRRRATIMGVRPPAMDASPKPAAAGNQGWKEEQRLIGTGESWNLMGDVPLPSETTRLGHIFIYLFIYIYINI